MLLKVVTPRGAGGLTFCESSGANFIFFIMVLACAGGRDCVILMQPPLYPFSRRFNRDGEGGYCHSTGVCFKGVEWRDVSKMTVTPTAIAALLPNRVSWSAEAGRITDMLAAAALVAVVLPAVAVLLPPGWSGLHPGRRLEGGGQRWGSNLSSASEPPKFWQRTDICIFIPASICVHFDPCCFLILDQIGPTRKLAQSLWNSHYLTIISYQHDNALQRGKT